MLKLETHGKLWKRNGIIRQFEILFDFLCFFFRFLLINSPRTENERTSYQRPGESSPLGAWRAKNRMTNEHRDSPRFGLNQNDRRQRADESSNWRVREKKRLNRYIFS